MGFKYYELPVDSTPQTFTVFIGGIQWEATLRWNHAGDYWTLDFVDQAGARQVKAIPVVMGVDLLAQYRHLGFTGALIVKSISAGYPPPTFKSLGGEHQLIIVTEE